MKTGKHTTDILLNLLPHDKRWRQFTVHLTSHTTVILNPSMSDNSTSIHLQRKRLWLEVTCLKKIKGFTKHILHPAIQQQIFINISSAKSAGLKPD